MNELEIFKNKELGEVRVVIIDEEPWFVGKDITDILGYKNGSRDINRHVDEEDRQNYQNSTFESNRGLTIINESGLYSLILSSKLSSAKKFKRWVTDDVLPAIRKHGAYMTPKTIEETLTNPDFIIQLATTLKEEQKKRKLAEQQAKEKQIVIDTVIKDDRLFSVGSVGKVLKPYCKLMGGRNIFKFLRQKSIIIDKEGTHTHNMPYAKYDKYFEVKYVDSEYGTHSKCYFNGTGLKWFLNKLVKEGYINNEQKTKVENNLK